MLTEVRRVSVLSKFAFSFSYSFSGGDLRKACNGALLLGKSFLMGCITYLFMAKEGH